MNDATSSHWFAMLVEAACPALLAIVTADLADLGASLAAFVANCCALAFTTDVFEGSSDCTELAILITESNCDDATSLPESIAALTSSTSELQSFLAS